MSFCNTLGASEAGGAPRPSQRPRASGSWKGDAHPQLLAIHTGFPWVRSGLLGVCAARREKAALIGGQVPLSHSTVSGALTAGGGQQGPQVFLAAGLLRVQMPLGTKAMAVCKDPS